ncbi:MAG: adenylosuccinate synthetase, partial [Planctomycetota bacterium]
MSSICVFGAQWGDEGKGKIIDHLASGVDVVVRYQGGSNAGHTVVADGVKYVLHLIPSGVLHPGRMNVIGNGVALDPLQLVAEIKELQEAGVEVGPDNLAISARAHVIFDHHQGLDKLAEGQRGDRRIGTTGRGIGPAYADKAARSGLRVCDLLDRKSFATRFKSTLREKNDLRERLFGAEPLDVDAQLERYASVADHIEPLVGATGAYLRQADRDGKHILFE